MIAVDIVKIDIVGAGTGTQEKPEVGAASITRALIARHWENECLLSGTSARLLLGRIKRTTTS